MKYLRLGVVILLSIYCNSAIFAKTKTNFKENTQQQTIKQKIDKKFTISGFIREEGSAELLIGVYVYVPALKIGTTTNTYGFYSLTLPESDSISIIYSFIGYTAEKRNIKLNENQNINVNLKSGIVLNEVVITADKGLRQADKQQMSTISVPITQIKNIPSLLGEKDVLKVLQLMPGVQKGMEGSSGIYVRGGGPDQNLIILDDATVYNASHLFGFFSLFNGDALKSVELTKGGFPAHYGGRLSSVVDMNMKEGNKESWHGEGGIGLISSRLTIEGPLQKNKSSILLSARRTYFDVISRPIMKSQGDGNAGYYFYDLNAKINYDFGQKNKLYLSGYFGKDLFSFTNDENGYKENAGFNWGNGTATLRWNHLFNNKLFSNSSLIYSKYKFQIFSKHNDSQIDGDFYAKYNSGITDYSLKHDFDYIPNPQHWIKTGFSSTQHNFTPYAYIEKNQTSNTKKDNTQTISSLENSIYLEDIFHPIDYLKINGGIRYTSFICKSKNYHSIEPRLSTSLQIKDDLAIKASYAQMSQFVHLLSTSGISLPIDLWVPSTKRIQPQESKQIALGLAKDFSDPLLSVTLEGYYKKMNHIIGYKEGATYLNIDNAESASNSQWENNITSGKGWSYGVELLIQKKVGRFNGWIGYTLSWTQLQFDSLNFGRKFYAHYDRRHDISIVGIYQLTDNITISGTWVYGTGNAVTLRYAQYEVLVHNEGALTGVNQPNNMYNTVECYDNKNDFRMKAYHRLDLGIQFHKKKKWGERTWEISVYNVYNQKNPFYYYSSIENNVGKLKQISLFPIIPSISYSFKF